MECDCHLHFAEEETETQSLLKVTRRDGLSHQGGQPCTSLGSVQRLELLVAPLQLLSLPSAHCLLDSELLQILPAKMFPFGFLISLNFSRLEGPGSLNSNQRLWRSEFFFSSSPSFPPSALPRVPVPLPVFPPLSLYFLSSLLQRVKQGKTCIQWLVTTSHHTVTQNGLPRSSFPGEWRSESSRC